MSPHAVAPLLIVGIVAIVIVLAKSEFFGLKLNLEIKPIEVLGSLLSAYLVYLAATLQTTLTAKSSNDRVEKDILLRSIEKSEEKLRLVSKAFSVEVLDKGMVHPEAMAKITVLARDLSNSISQIENKLKISRFSHMTFALFEVRKLYMEYKRLTTDLPIGSKVEPIIRNEESRMEEKLSLALTKMAFQLNVATANQEEKRSQ